MTAPVILVEAQPRRAVDGTVQTVRLAGGGAMVQYQYGGNAWRAGINRLPTAIASLEYEGGEFPTGSIPAALELEWAPARAADLAELAALMWIDAPITVRIGAEGTALPPVAHAGLVMEVTTTPTSLKIQLADPAISLKKPLLTARYAGTGGLEGPIEWTGQIRKRIWGQIWNLRGDPIDKANNIYCFADPLRPLQAIQTLRDKGATAAVITPLAWQGSAAATFAALQAAAAPQGGGVVCPSIACAKWWTQPAGDLCADLQGEIGGGYVDTTADIAQRLVQEVGGPVFAAGTITAARGARPMTIGWAVLDDTTTTAAMLDQLTGNASLLWLLNNANEIVLRAWEWGASVATVRSHEASRRKVLRPLATRKLGYKHNELVMVRGDIAGIVLDGFVSADLIPPSLTVPAAADGSVASWAGISGEFQVRDLASGGALIALGVTYTVQSATGATAAIDSAGHWSISAMSADTAKVVFRAAYGGLTYDRLLSLAKARAGTNGVNGAPGAPGAPGAQGLPGAPGANGQTFYTWYAYADSADGQINFSPGFPGARVYQGIAQNKTVATESTNPADYVWSSYTGPPGFGLAAANGAEVAGSKLIGRNPVAWNQQVYSTESFVGGAYVSFKLEQRSDGNYGAVMVGLNTDPTATDWTTLDYALYAEGGIASGNLFASESGAQVALGTWVTTDSFAVHYDGARIRYYKNGTVIRTVTGVAAGIRFFLASALAATGVHASITAWAAAGAAGDPGVPGVSPWALNLSPPNVTIRTSSTGVVNTGQLPRPVAVSLLQGTVDQLAGAVITLVPSSAAIAGTYSAGSISLTQADAAGYIDVTATVAGTAVATKRVEIVRQPDPAPPISATSLSAAAVAAISAVSFGPPDLALTMAANASGQIVLQAGARYLVQDSSITQVRNITLAGCASWRAEASGVWSYGAETIGSQATDNKQISTVEGGLSILQTITGLTPGARYVVGLSLRKSSGSASIADATIDITVHQ